MPTTSTQKALRIAEELHRAGRLAEAEKKCRAILLQNPNDLEALKLACVLARQQGRAAEAREIVARAIEAHPHVAELHAELGELFRKAGMREQAKAAFDQAVELNPLQPAFHNSLAGVLYEDRRFDEALAECRRAIEIKQDDASAWSNCGGVLRELGRLEEAAAAMEIALRLQPMLAPSHLNLALIRAGQGRFDEAMKCTACAIAIRPDYPEANYNLGILHLLLGDMQRGWREYQWRPTRKVPSTRPIWRSQDLRGRTLGLFSEQGFGDTIQFVRYVPLLEQRGARVWLACRADLARLLKPMVEVVQPGEVLPEHDFCCPLLDLPMIFGTTIESIPAPVPYLKSEAARGKPDKFRVGLAWAGSSEHRDDTRRSIRFEQLKPIVALTNIEYVNLQVGPAAREAVGSALMHPSNAPRDFADTSAVIETLDLVISVDTAVAHLAGAMGKTVWILLAKTPDWRWMLNRADSPWYPTMRLFRQQTFGNWEQPIGEIARKLIEFERSSAK